LSLSLTSREAFRARGASRCATCVARCLGGGPAVVDFFAKPKPKPKHAKKQISKKAGFTHSKNSLQRLAY
jgi:hypothetical protein